MQLSCQHMADSVVAYQKQRAESAMRPLWLSPQNDSACRAGVQAQLGADDVHNAAQTILQAEELNGELRAIAFSCCDLLRRPTQSRSGASAPNTCSVRVVWKIHRRQCAIGPTHNLSLFHRSTVNACGRG